MTYTQESLKDRVKECIGKLADKRVEYFKEGKNKAADVTIDYDVGDGRILLVWWPKNTTIDVCWSPNSAGYGDLGLPFGSVSTEHFGIDSMIFLIVTMINCFVEE